MSSDKKNPEPKTKILLIDDDLVDQKVFVRTLEESSLDYELQILDEPESILTADSVEHYSSFDVVFLDYNFPSGVSSSLVHLLKKHWNFKKPIVLITGSKSEILKDNVEAYENVFYKHKCEESYKSLTSLITSLV